MAKKAQDTDIERKVNRSQLIRDLIKENPKIKASEAVSALAKRGIKIRAGLFYLVKGALSGQKRRRQKNQHKAVDLASSSGMASPAAPKSDALATIRKVKGLAADVGGLRTLKGIVDALSE